MSYFLLILIFITPAFAELEKIHIKNLNLTYAQPSGTGEFEKLSIGVSLSETPYPVAIQRQENSFDITSPFVDFQWIKPFPFIHNAQNFQVTNFNLGIDYQKQSVSGELLNFTDEKNATYILNKYIISCNGHSSRPYPADRLKEDCLEEMTVSVERMDLPFEFFTTLGSQLPQAPNETGDIPAHDLTLKNSKGDFFAAVRIRVILSAYLRVWGFTQLENEGQTLAIRVDQIKYGILPVTTLVMNELRRQVRHPDVTIDPPWVRIKLGN